MRLTTVDCLSVKTIATQWVSDLLAGDGKCGIFRNTLCDGFKFSRKFGRPSTDCIASMRVTSAPHAVDPIQRIDRQPSADRFAAMIHSQ
jgi:hypothetical protein